MPDVMKELYQQFSKSELSSIAEELELDIDVQLNSRKIIDAVLKDIEENGLPELDTCSELLGEFLVAAELYDADGNVVEKQQAITVEAKPVAATKPVEQETVNVPQCYGFEDDKDPSCQICKLQAICKQTRMDNRPACFGKLFSEHDENCKACIEYNFCRIETAKLPNKK